MTPEDLREDRVAMADIHLRIVLLSQKELQAS